MILWYIYFGKKYFFVFLFFVVKERLWFKNCFYCIIMCEYWFLFLLVLVMWMMNFLFIWCGEGSLGVYGWFGNFVGFDKLFIL